MKSIIYTAALCLSLTFLFIEQTKGQALFPEKDSVATIPDSLEIIFAQQVSMERCGMFLGQPGDPFTLYQDSATLAEEIKTKRFIGQCKEFKPPEIDFDHYALVGMSFFIDCNGHVFLRVARDSAARVYRIYADIYYGGCRGMTSSEHWLLLPALQEEYKIEITTNRIDDF